MMTKRHLSLLALPAFLATTACGWVVEDEPMAEAASALEKNDLNAARLHLAKVLKDTPGDHQARLLYADAMLRLGDGLGAQAALEHLPTTMLESDHATALMAHAKLLQEKAEDALEWAGKSDISDPRGQWVRIGALLASGRDTEAVSLADQALADHPDDARLLALRGEMALRQRRLEHAKTFSQRALAADGTDLNTLMLAGRIALLSEDFAAAETHYAQAADAHPSVLGPLLSLAAVRADLGEIADAAATLKTLRGIAPQHPMGMFLDAKLAFVSGDLDRAHQIMQAAEGSLRKVPAAQLLMGEIAHLRGNHEQSIAFLRPFLRDNPGHVQGATVMAQALLAVGETAKAWAIVELPASRAVASPQLLALASKLSQELGQADAFAARLGAVSPPEDLSTRLAAADRAMGRKDWTEAQEIYAGLRQQGMETSALVLNNSAIAELETGNVSEALSLARRAIALTPDDPFVMDTLGWALMRSDGGKGEALKWLGRAHAAAPGNLEFRWHYAAALAENGRRGDARRMIAGVRQFANAAQREHIDTLLSQL